MTDNYEVRKFNSRVQYIDNVNSLNIGSLSSESIHKRRKQVESALESGDITDSRTYNELNRLLDIIERNL